MCSIYAESVRLYIQKTNVGAEKIDGSTLKIYKIVLSIFFLKDKLEQVGFFEEIFLIANISMKIILKMPFFSLNNANV